MRGTQTLLMACAALLASGCGGYADLPVQIREQTEFLIESVDLYPGAVGTLQVSVVAPDDVEGPLWLVGHPDVLASDQDVTIVGWAFGPCSAWPSAGLTQVNTESEDADTLRLCISVYTPPNVRPEGMLVGAVIDARAQARRFTAIGEVATP